MNSKEYREIAQRLRKAKGAYLAKYGPTSEAQERSQQRVMAYIEQSVRTNSQPKFAYPRLGMMMGFLRYFMPPPVAYGTMAIVVFLGIGMAAAASLNALPGQSLYQAKIAMEQTHVRFVSNPAERAKVQMELAGRRLEEVRSSVSSPEQEDQVLRHFSKTVKEAKATLKQAGDPLQVEAAQQELNKKAQEYEQKLLETKIANKTNREVGVAAYDEAEQALREVSEVAEEPNVTEE